MQAIYADIDRLAPAKLDTLSWRPKLPLFQWPLGAAVKQALRIALWLGLLAWRGSGTKRSASSCMTQPAFLFHLLRPLWLLALIPVAAIFAMLLWRQIRRAQWGGVIAPHLLQHLIVATWPGDAASARFTS